MIIIIGLGNPGKKYEKTRHNLGFRAINEFFKKNRDTSNFSNFKFEKKFQALIAEGKFNNNKIILAKPQTFMNLSGKSVKELVENCKLKIENLIVVHDDIDLPLGKIRISKGSGAAGHKGVESIIKDLGTKDFVRFRIGIRPKNSTFPTTVQNVEKPSTGAKLGAGLVPHRNKVSGAGFVLQNFKKEEEKIAKEIIKKTVKAIEITLKDGLEKAMNQFNK